MWADGQTQQAELDIFYEFLEKHVRHLNQMAGYDAFELEDAVRFVARFLKERPAPEMLETLRNLAACSGLHQTNQQQRKLFEKSLLTLCLDIASSSVVDYPSGVQERFSAAEKQCFFEILDTFEKTERAGDCAGGRL